MNESCLFCKWKITQPNVNTSVVLLCVQLWLIMNRNICVCRSQFLLYLGASGLHKTCFTLPQQPRVNGFTPPLNFPVTWEQREEFYFQHTEDSGKQLSLTQWTVMWIENNSLCNRCHALTTKGNQVGKASKWFWVGVCNMRLRFCLYICVCYYTDQINIFSVV